MTVKIALSGNPNSGKTTLFNELTGSNQYVGNWPGVTVEKKEGTLIGHPDVIVQDLPGIYSLSPYTLEEVVARNYLVNDRPDVILNIVDGSNIERNLYLTTQLIELGGPVVMAINMMDVVRKKGDEIDTEKLSKAIGCKVCEMSAAKGEGSNEAAELAIQAAKENKEIELPHVFTGSIEHALAHIEESIQDFVEPRYLRWYAIKVFERDPKVLEELKLADDLKEHLEQHIKDCEKECDDDAESIITNARYEYIDKIVAKSVKKKAEDHAMTVSDKIDSIVTSRVLALPIFALVMFLLYFISITTVGNFVTNWTNDVLFGEIIPPLVSGWLTSVGCAAWLQSLIVNGIISGVGAVIGFVPQMLVLFLLLAILEDVGYMSRVAFIMDKVFRKFGLSGKSFIPMLISSGCGVPGIMASRTIENEKDRRMTIMTTTFIPCGAKMPMIGLIAGAMFHGSGLVATGAYFIGAAAVVISGIILKKTKAFSGDVSPFVMELPAYHWPVPRNVFSAMWERGWSFIKRAGTVILASSIILWFLQSFGFENGSFMMVDDNNVSLLAYLGRGISWIFIPIGFGDWQSAVATLTGFIAKENIVATFGVLFNTEGTAASSSLLNAIASHYTLLAGLSFMIFNLLCAPCIAAMSAIHKEMNSGKWTAAAISYMCIFAYAVCFMIYHFGLLFTAGTFDLLTCIAIGILVLFIYLIVRKNPYADIHDKKTAVDAAE